MYFRHLLQHFLFLPPPLIDRQVERSKQRRCCSSPGDGILILDKRSCFHGGGITLALFNMLIIYITTYDYPQQIVGILLLLFSIRHNHHLEAFIFARVVGRIRLSLDRLENPTRPILLIGKGSGVEHLYGDGVIRLKSAKWQEFKRIIQIKTLLINIFRIKIKKQLYRF